MTAPVPRILVAEDEAIVAHDIRATLMRAGYEVAGICSTGAAAVEKAAVLLPDVVLMDIGLEGSMDGITAAATLREAHEIPVVYLTAHADRDTIDRAKRTRPLGYVVKPFDEQELLAAIEIGLWRRATEITDGEDGRHELSVALMQVREDEARRVARELHDEAGQLLTGVHLSLHDLARDLEPAQREKVRGIRSLVDRVQDDLRRIAHEMRPSILDDLGLDAAVRALASGAGERAAIPVTVAGMVVRRLDPAVEVAVYRVVQEALNNALRHAHPRAVAIHVTADGGMLRCSVRDDGEGFDLPFARQPGNSGMGIASMRERLTAVGGALRIQSARGLGTEVLVSVPLGEN